MQYCNFQGTTWDSVNNCTDKMQNMMSGIAVKDSTVKAEVVPAVTEPDSGSTGGEGEETTVKAAWDAAGNRSSILRTDSTCRCQCKRRLEDCNSSRSRYNR